MNKNSTDKQTRAHLKELDRLCGKVEKLCPSLQDLLMRCASGTPHASLLERVEEFQQMTGMVQAAVFALQEQATSTGGAASQQMAARIVRWMRGSESGPQQRPARGSQQEGGDEPALRGNLRHYPLLALLDSLARQSMTGILSVEAPKETMRLHIIQGSIERLDCNPLRRGERLGEILAEDGVVDLEIIHSFLDLHGKTASSLGAALVEKSIVSEDQLGTALVRQLELRLERLLTIQNAPFEFHCRDVAASQGLSVSIEDLRIDEESGSLTVETAQPETPQRAPALSAAAPPSSAEESEAARKWQGGTGNSWDTPR